VATKIDALDEPGRFESLQRRALDDAKPFFAISSVTGKGVRELVNAVAAKLDELSADRNRTDTVELAL
jgi:selenocysteine-specific translation elongation factor